MLIDFEFDDCKLSDFDMTIMSFNGSDDELDVGNKINEPDYKPSSSNEYLALGLNYDSPISANFQIMNYNCQSKETIYLTDEKINILMRWLNRKKYCIFRPIYDDGQYNDVFYKGTFNVELVKVGGKPIGLNLTFNANAPYGFRDIGEISLYFDDESLTEVEDGDMTDSLYVQNIEDVSDEIGHAYANVKIICKESGDLTIKNNLDPHNIIVVKNCVENEIIYLYGKTKIIQSSVVHDKLFNDFNYNFFRVCNTYEDSLNVFTCNIKADIEVKYDPVRKVGIVL